MIIHDEFLREQVIDEARSYLGVPWRHMGRSRMGIDCVGLVVLVGSTLGLHQYPDDVRYSRKAVGATLLEPFRAFSVQVGIPRMLPGDVLIARDRMFPQHCGIVGVRADGTITFIHATAHKKKVVEEPLSYAVKDGDAITAFRFNFLTDGED